MKERRLYKFLKFIGRKGTFWLGLNVLSGVGLGFLELALSLVMAYLLKTLGITGQVPDLPFGIPQPLFDVRSFLIILISIGLLKSFAQFLVSHSANVANEAIGVRLRLILLYDNFSLKTGFVSLADIQTKISEVFPRATSFAYFLAISAAPAIQCAFIFLVMMRRDFLETILGVGGIGIAGLVVTAMNRRVASLAKQITPLSEKYNARVIRNVRNWFFLKALKTMPYEHEQLNRMLIGNSSMVSRVNYLSTLAAVLPSSIGILIISGMIEVQTTSPRISGLAFLSFLYLFVRFVQNLGIVANNLSSLNICYPNFKIAWKYFFTFSSTDISKALEPAAHFSPTGHNWETFIIPTKRTMESSLTPPVPPTVRFEKLTYAYLPHQNVLSDLDLTVAAGDQLAVVGPSGSGKSTLLALVLGVIHPTLGALKIDGENPEIYFSRPDTRISYVGPEPFLIEGSVRENMLYGRAERFSDAQIIAALELAQLGEWIRSSTLGLDHVMSENGEGLSTGQKQRLSLARALLAQPGLLILDEISANLDLETETQVARTIEGLKGKCTTLIVSHRAGIVAHVKNRLDLGG